MTTGIYRITNGRSGKVYVGSSVNAEQRWNTHRCALRNGQHNNPHLQHAWDKYGEVVFAFAILEEVNEDMLSPTEQRYLDEHMGPDCYNIAASAAAPMLGRAVTEETRRKLRRAGLGSTHTEAARRKIGDAIRGRKHTEEAILKMRAAKNTPSATETSRRVGKANRGRKHTEETRRKMGAAHMGNQYCLGYRHTEEARRNMSIAQKKRQVRERAALAAGEGVPCGQ